MITTTAEFIETVRKACFDHRNPVQIQMLAGACETLAAYQHDVGFIAGMLAAEEILAEEYKKALKQDGDDSNDG